MDRRPYPGAGLHGRRAGAAGARQPKVGVDRANWYKSGLNRTYLDLATYYRTAILPTRTRKPRDKAKDQLGLTGMARAFTELETNPQSAELSHPNGSVSYSIVKPSIVTNDGCV